MNDITDFRWTLRAPVDAPAWYDIRNSLMRTESHSSETIFEALQSKNLGGLAHGTVLLHELAHLIQDICTGWGLYQSELMMAMVVARAHILASMINKTGIRDAPIEIAVKSIHGVTARELVPEEYEIYDEFESIWNRFHQRSDRDLEISEIDIIESHAHSYQVIEHLLNEDFDKVNELLSGDMSEYTRALNLTASVLGAEGRLGGDHLFFMLVIHQIFCELAFSMPPGSPINVQPARLTSYEMDILMPESLSSRFRRILASALINLRPKTSEFLKSTEGFESLIMYVKRYSQWLKGVEVYTGYELSQKWMDSFSSPGEIALTEITPTTDPVRAYRAWGMEHWQPVSSAEVFENQLLKLMKTCPAFRLADSRGQLWYFELDSERARSDHLNVMNVSDFLGGVSGDLNGQAIMSELPRFLIDGKSTDVPCPLMGSCDYETPICHQSLAKGINPNCDAYETLDITMGIRLATVNGQSFT